MGDPVDPHQLGRYALAHLRVVVRLAEDCEPGVRVQVDEPGTDDSSRGIDLARRSERRVVAPVDRDPLVLDGHCGVEARAPAAIYHEPVTYEQVSHAPGHFYESATPRMPVGQLTATTSN